MKSKKLVTINEPVKYYLPAEEIYDVIEVDHIAVGHGGQDKVEKETGRKYANIFKRNGKIIFINV